MKIKLSIPQIKYYLLKLFVIIMIFSTQLNSLTYGKIEMPAFPDLSLIDQSFPNQPITIEIKAVCMIPIEDGRIILFIPEFYQKPTQEIIIWEGSLDKPTTVTKVVSYGTSPTEKYEFKSNFRFIPSNIKTNEMGIGIYLYTDKG